MKVQVVGATQFFPPEDTAGWESDAEGGAALIEMAGRACYQSWHKPNPDTATNKGYIEHILDVKHLSVIEHAVVSMYITGISRSLSHELVRHRTFSYSQLSQRFVDESARGEEPVIPPAFRDDQEAVEKIERNYWNSMQDYDWLVEHAIEQGYKRKQAREAARSVLPNDSETKIVVTGNMRSWRHFLHMRGSEGADKEIRELAVEVYKKLLNVPHLVNVLGDVEIYQGGDGSLALRVGKPEGA